MKADEYVVNELLNEKQKNEQLEAANVYLRSDIKALEKKHNLVKSLFACEETIGGTGYLITVTDIKGNYGSIIATTYHKNPSEIEPEFMELLNALELVLPSPSNEDLENDPSLVNDALEKAEELKAEKESEE